MGEFPAATSSLPERTYARTTGWLYFLLASAGLFADHLWNMFHLSGALLIIHFSLGMAGLTIARQGGTRSCRIYALFTGAILLAWAGFGTWSPRLLSPQPLPLENALHVITGLWAFYGPGNDLWAWLTRRHPGNGSD